ncbi:MAG: GIY-YIG nuclease family protein [bacterium]|nr:GIY-YIG nuclease family protein [bacterium]
MVRTPRFSAGGGPAFGGQCGKTGLQSGINHFLYILKSIGNARYYIGTTADTDTRLNQHNNGRVKSTKAYRPWVIAYTKIFSNKISARQTEIHLKKNYQARKALFDKIEEV